MVELEIKEDMIKFYPRKPRGLHFIILLLFICFSCCKPFTIITTNGKYKSIWTGRQFTKHSCYRKIYETIQDTVENYTVQKTWEKRQICGFYSWPVKLCTITYNKQSKPIEKTIIRRGRYNKRNKTKTIVYHENFDGLTEADINALKKNLKK